LRSLQGGELDEVEDPSDNSASPMAEIIDLSLVAEARNTLNHLLETRGIAWFLRDDRKKPFQLEPSRVEMVVRTAQKGRRRPLQRAVDHARKEVRRELIKRVVAEMLDTGL
jgi:hypothetical protein